MTTYIEDEVGYSSQYAATPPSGLKVATRARPTDGAAIQSVYLEGGQVSPAADLTMSEFGERRVAAPGNRSDVEFIYDKQPLIYDDISAGTGSATHQANGRDVLLAIGGAGVGAIAGMRRRAWVPYTPGSGQEIDITGTVDAANLGGTMYAFLRSTVSGVTTLETVAQSAWDAATSGVNWQYSQIFRMSFQSLKVGRIQFAMSRAGGLVKVCEITNDNERVTGYWQSASLPPYWKIENEAANTVVEFGYGDEFNGIGFRYVMNGLKATATARAICGTVKSQGGVPLLEMPGYPFSTPIMATRTVSNALLPVLSIRVAATFNSLVNRSLAIPFSFAVQTDNPIDYVVLYRPSLTGASWSAVDATYSGMEYDVSATAVSGGVRVATDFASSGRASTAFGEGLLGRTIMSLGASADILTLAAIRATGSNAAVKAAFDWKEIR